MKTSTLALLSLLFAVETFAQNEKRFFINEFSVSVNHSNLSNYNTENGNGAGAGAYHTMLADKRINLLFGVEYNRTRQFKRSMDAGHFEDLRDVTYTIDIISIPLLVRVNFGKKKKLFMEAGAFLDLNVRPKSKGILHDYISGNNYLFNGDAGFSLYNYGPSGGIGYSIPFGKYAFLVRADYKHGMRVQQYNIDIIKNSYMRLLLGLKI